MGKTRFAPQVKKALGQRYEKWAKSCEVTSIKIIKAMNKHAASMNGPGTREMLVKMYMAPIAVASKTLLHQTADYLSNNIENKDAVRMLAMSTFLEMMVENPRDDMEVHVTLSKKKK